MGGERCSRHPVEEHDVVALGSPPEVLEREGPDPVRVERGGELVVEERGLARRGGQAALEPGEVEDGLGPVFPDPSLDERPGVAQLPEVVLGARDDGPPGVGEARRVGIAESITRDLVHAGALRGDRATLAGGCQRGRCATWDVVARLPHDRDDGGRKEARACISSLSVTGRAKRRARANHHEAPLDRGRVDRCEAAPSRGAHGRGACVRRAPGGPPRLAAAGSLASRLARGLPARGGASTARVAGSARSRGGGLTRSRARGLAPRRLPGVSAAAARSLLRATDTLSARDLVGARAPAERQA